jgi:hypothetical protein
VVSRVKIECCNSSEAAFALMADRRGWTVCRSGWPDFLVVKDDKRFFVEVKSTKDGLTSSQRTMFDALEKLGIEVTVWWEARPETLLPWRKFQKFYSRTKAAALKRAYANGELRR